MAQVFISYAREDREYAHTLADLLAKRGFKVWWDWNLVGGEQFRDAIRRALDGSERAIVLWSHHSVASPFVIDEASAARAQTKLVPLLIDEASPPFGFGDLHTIDTRDFEADLDAIVAALEGRVLPAGTPTRRLFRRGTIMQWLAIAAPIAAAAALYYVLAMKPSETPQQAAEAALREFDAIQGLYSNVKNASLTCSGARDLVERIRPYLHSTRRVPPSFDYTVLNPKPQGEPSVAELARDRIGRIKSVRKDCFPA